MTLNPMPVTVGLGETVYLAAHVDPRNRWNGFLVPLFDRATVDRIAAENEALAAEYGADAVESLTWDGDTLIQSDVNYPDEPVRIAPTVVDGVPLWAVGSGWTWQEIMPNYEGETTPLIRRAVAAGILSPAALTMRPLDVLIQYQEANALGPGEAIRDILAEIERAGA